MNRYIKRALHLGKVFDLKVNTFIAGAQKAGTTSLFNHLVLHPECTGPRGKEPQFFEKDKHYYYWHKFYPSLNKKLGRIWYHYRYPGHNKILMDATPEYLYRKEVPERIKDYNPNAKIIIILRDPIERAFSAWNAYRYMAFNGSGNMRYKSSRNYNNKIGEYFFDGIFPSFRETVEMEIEWIAKNEDIVEPSIVRRGFYSEQIKRWLSFFPREQLLIILSEEFRENKIEILNKVTEFLNISPLNIQEDRKIYSNSKQYPETMSPEVKGKLMELYKEKNADLPELIGKNPDWEIF